MKVARMLRPHEDLTAGIKLVQMSDALRQLSRNEKLKLMEALWEDLSRPDGEFESPAWHAKELAETEQRLAEGKEEVMDWEKAKERLRSKLG